MLQAGSFVTQSSYISGQYVRGRTAAAFGVQGGRTDRYLDPPVEGNFTNKAFNSGISGSLERDWSQQNRLRLSLYRQRTGLLVPNEGFQQQAGQRQDRRNAETLGQLSYQRTLSPRLLASFREWGETFPQTSGRIRSPLPSWPASSEACGKDMQRQPVGASGQPRAENRCGGDLVFCA